MSKIYRMSDRIRLKVDDLEIKIAPLSIHQKAEVEEAASKGTSSALLKATTSAISYALRDVKGLVDASGNPYELEWDESGKLTEDCISELFNLKASEKLSTIALSLINGIPDEFTSPITGEKLEGVEFIVEGKPSTGKKTRASGK